MSEITSGRPKRLFEMIDDLITRREEISRMIWLVVIAAAALNVLTGFIGAWAWEKYDNVWWLWTVPALILMIFVILAVWSYAGRISNQVHFEILFPFRNAAQVETVKGNYYKPLAEFEQRVGEFFMQSSKETTAIAAEWKANIEKGRRTVLHSHSPHLLRFLNDLAEFFVFDTLVHFSKKSLSPGARFMRYGWVRPNYKSPMVFKRGAELSPLKTNLIFQQLPDLVPQSMKFLKGFKLQRKPLEKIDAGKDQEKKNAGYFEFVSGYGSVRFTISPFPIVMGGDERDAHLISRYCGLSKDNLIVIKIPFMMTVDFRGLRPLRKKFSEKFAPWIEDLVDAVEHNLDWQHCAQHDMERMVKELLKQKI